MKTKENRFFVIMLAAVITAILLLSLARFLNGSGQKRYTVSVVVENSSDNRWTAFRMGVQQAARDENISLSVVSTDKIASIQQEGKLISQEISNGADGIITELRSSGGTADVLAELSRSVPVILLNTQAETSGSVDGSIAYAGLDNTAVGQTLAEEILSTAEVSERALQIGIVAGNQQQFALQERLKAAEDRLSEENVSIVWTVSGDTQETEIRQQNAGRPADVILALDDSSLLDAVHYMQNTGRKYLRLYGVGCSEELVYDLDAGLIQSMLMPEEFNLGYQAVLSLSDRLNHREGQLREQLVGFHVVNRENMYDEENQRLLFPAVE